MGELEKKNKQVTALLKEKEGQYDQLRTRTEEKDTLISNMERDVSRLEDELYKSKEKFQKMTEDYELL